MESEKFNIRLTVAGKTFPLTIERAKEERYRRAERHLNDTIEMYRKHFRAENDEYVAMAALQVAVELVELEMKGNMDSEEANLREIEKQIDKYLNEI